MPKKTIHTGIITDNADPEKRGRLNIECPTIVSGDIMEWVDPKFFFIDSSKNAGAFFIPNIGSQVEVEIEDEEDSQVNGLEAKWMCAVYPIGTVPEEFETNYPERRGWKTSAGHVFYFDDTSDQLTFQYTHPSGTEIKVDNSGNILLNAGSGKSVFVGTDADEAIVRGNELRTQLNNFLSLKYDTHTHTVSGPSTGIPIVTGTTINTDVLSDDHKVK